MTPYHRMCNRIFEHLNTAVIQMTQILSEKLKYKWKNSLKKLRYRYNCTKHSVIGYSAYFPFERNLNWQADVIFSEH